MNFFTRFEKQELLLIHTLYFNYQQNLGIFMMEKLGEQKLSDRGLFSLLDSTSNKKLFNDIKTVEDLNKVLIEKSNFIGDLFDKKLK